MNAANDEGKLTCMLPMNGQARNSHFYICYWICPFRRLCKCL